MPTDTLLSANEVKTPETVTQNEPAKQVVQEQPKTTTTPPAKAEKDVLKTPESFDITSEDAKELFDGLETPEKKDEPVVKPSVAKKAEPVKKPEEPVKPTEDQNKPLPTARDYTGFSPEEVAVLKQMSNQAFYFTLNKIKQSQELEAKLKTAENSTYYQHPEGYTLDPQYQELKSNVFKADSEAKAWYNALMKIKAGESWTAPTAWGENGELVFGTEQPATNEAEELVRQRMSVAAGLAQQYRGQVKSFAGTYKQQIDAATNQLNQVQASKFPWVADPKLLDQTVEIPGAGSHTIKSIKDNFMSLIPQQYRGHILAELGANMYAVIHKYNAEIAAKDNQLKLATTKREETFRAEPTSHESQATPPEKPKTLHGWSAEFSSDDIPS